MEMHGIEYDYCNACVKAVIAAYCSVMEVPAQLALNKTDYGKGDTLGLDAIPEIIISERIKEYDANAILITEEIDEADLKRWPNISNPVLQPLMLFSDPTDRSKFLKKFFEKISKGKPTSKIGKLMNEIDCIKVWESMFDSSESPASITGATIAITCVRKGSIIFSVILNYITKTIFVACSIGIFYMKLPKLSGTKIKKIDFSHIIKNDKTLSFPLAKEICGSTDDFMRYVTFLGKEGYEENFSNSMIFVENPRNFLHHTEPGGPSRVLYLSELQKEYNPIGFIMANGEKIGEWIHWLSFVKFATKKKGGPALRIFEIAAKRPMTKAGVLMSTTVPYSIFREQGSSTFLDISQLRNFDKPNKFRSMLVITPFDNETIIHIMMQHAYREIKLSS